MPDRHRLHLREVDLGLDGEEAVDLPLRRELGCELLEVDDRRARVDLHLFWAFLVVKIQIITRSFNLAPFK